jgi:hypothetical protein
MKGVAILLLALLPDRASPHDVTFEPASIHIATDARQAVCRPASSLTQSLCDQLMTLTKTGAVCVTTAAVAVKGMLKTILVPPSSVNSGASAVGPFWRRR